MGGGASARSHNDRNNPLPVDPIDPGRETPLLHPSHLSTTATQRSRRGNEPPTKPGGLIITMISAKLLGRCGARVPARLPRVTRSPLHNTGKPATSVRGLRTSPALLFKSSAASDHPGDDFEFAFSKDRGQKPPTASEPAPARRVEAAVAPFTDEALKLAKGFGFLFE